MEKTPLVISFGGTLRGMAHKRVTAADLVGAIFFLGCHRQHVVSTKAALEEVGIVESVRIELVTYTSSY